MANDVKHILMHVRYLHFSKLLWHIKYRTMTELSDSAVSEALDSLKKDGRIVLPSRRDRDQIYTQAKAERWQGIQKVNDNELRLVS